MSIYDIPESLLDASSKILEERETFIKAYIYKGEGINISRRGRGMSAPIVLKVNSKEIGEFKNQAAAEKAGKQYIDGGMKESIDEAVSKKPVSKDNPLYKMVTDLFPDAKNIKSGHYKNHGRVSFETNYNNKGKKVGKHTREYQYDLLDVADGGGALQPFKNPLDEGLGGIAATDYDGKSIKSKHGTRQEIEKKLIKGKNLPWKKLKELIDAYMGAGGTQKEFDNLRKKYKHLNVNSATGKPMKEEECGCGEECDCEDCKAKHQKEENPCWDGYEMVGMKMKDGKEVPNCVPVKEDINDFLNNVLSEKAPPDEKIKKWLEDPKVQASFKDQYGERYKEVMFGKAWKMYDDKQEEKGNE